MKKLLIVALVAVIGLLASVAVPVVVVLCSVPHGGCS